MFAFFTPRVFRGWCPLVLNAIVVAGASAQFGTPVPLPKLEGKITSLGDVDGDGMLTLADITVSDVPDRARNTFSFARLDASVGWDVAFAELKAAHPEMSHFAPIAVVEGNFMLTDPPVDRAAPPEGRRLIRGSGGLRLYLVRSSQTESEKASFAGYALETRVFQPKTGAMQTAENLAAERSSQYGFLANIFPHPPMSVRQVKAFRGLDGYPWLVCGCSAAPDDFASVDSSEVAAVKKTRVFRWNSATTAFVEVAVPQFDVLTNTWGVGVGDLNADGNPDLVLGRYKLDFLPSANKILLGRSNGTFELIQSSHDPFLAHPDPTTDIEVADLDADGNLDIVVANRYRARKFIELISRNYVLWGNGIDIVPGQLDQPKFLGPQYLELDGVTDLTVEQEDGVRDTVAIDVADADHDGDLDIVAGNHGVDGGPFIEDNVLPPQNGTGTTYGAAWARNLDSVYENKSWHVFKKYDLPETGSLRGVTTDIMFVDVVRPNRSEASGKSVWDFRFNIAEQTGTSISSPWEGGLADGYPEILRVARGASQSRLDWFLNDTNWGPSFGVDHPTFESYFDGMAWVNFSDPNIYSWRFARVSGGATPIMLSSSQPDVTYFEGQFKPASFYNFRGLAPSNLDGFLQTAIVGDFVPDRPFQSTYLEGEDWPHSLTAGPFGSSVYAPDLLLGMGYELSGLANRLYPFCAFHSVLTVAGGEYAGLLGRAGAGSASFTAGWTEYTSKGYGIASFDADNDGDFDVIAARRTGALLYVNQGNPTGTGGVEGKFVQQKDTAKWPAVDTPYAHNIFFREDACAGDFDGDGDQDVILNGFAGTQDFNAGYSRGERDEDVTQQSWLHGQSLNARMFQGTQLLENLTVASSSPSPGTFAHRSDRLDFNGRMTTGLGGDRSFAADLDGDGDLDVIEPSWAIMAPTDGGYPGYSGDPSNSGTGMAQWAALDYDNITDYKALAFRYWENLGTSTSTWFKDVAPDRIRCRVPSTGSEHFGPLDSLGGSDYGSGTAHEKLHKRHHLAQTLADYNNDGFIDMCVGYQSTTDQVNHGYNMYLADSTGTLWDATPLMPNWMSAVAGGPGVSLSFASNDHDQDGDVDLFISLWNSNQPTRLLENLHGTAVVAPPGWSVPKCIFAAKPFLYDATSAPTGWVEGFRELLNSQAYGNGLGTMIPPPVLSQDQVFWIGHLDLDLDGDEDFAQFTQTAAHRFFESKVIDPSPRDRFVDRSSDHAYGTTSLTPVPYLDEVLDSMRITAHRGATPVEFDVADYDGDGLQDIVADYNERPLAFYKNTGVFGTSAGLPLGTNVNLAPIVTRVVPDLGVRAGAKMRFYGKRMRFVKRVDLIFGDLASPTWIESIANTTSTTYVVPHTTGRFMDVTIPTSVTHYGPFAVRVTRTNGTSPDIDSIVFQGSCLTLIAP